MSSPAQIVRADDDDDDVNRNEKYKDNPDNVTMVEIIAPSTLQEGYTFDAVHDGKIFPVTVPKGGVKSGQSFRVPFRPFNDTVSAEVLLMAEPIVVATEVTPIIDSNDNNRHNQPPYYPSPTIGKWKDGLCDCCTNGCCHPSLCMAIFLKQILMGQVLTRMRMTWCGLSSNGNGYKATFAITVWLTIGYWSCFLLIHHHEDDWFTMIWLLWCIYTIVVMIRLRYAVRSKYKIPQKSCHGCEDCCCVVFCSCCTISQLARQTGQYDYQRAYCCSNTGLPDVEQQQLDQGYTMEEAIIV